MTTDEPTAREQAMLTALAMATGAHTGDVNGVSLLYAQYRSDGGDVPLLVGALAGLAAMATDLLARGGGRDPGADPTVVPTLLALVADHIASHDHE